MSDTSRADGQPIRPAYRPVSSVSVYTWASASQPSELVIDVAGHINRSLGRNDAVMVSGRTLSTSRRTTTAGSSSGANMSWRTVKAAPAYVIVVDSERTRIDAMMSPPLISSGDPSSRNDREKSSRIFSGYTQASNDRFS